MCIVSLTNLYNERPTWLKVAHQELDKAVLAAYAATDPAANWSQDWADVCFDTGAGQPLPPGNPLSAKRAEVEKRVLENLLRQNLARSTNPPVVTPEKPPKQPNKRQSKT